VVPGAAVTKSLTEVHCEWEEKEKEQQEEEEEEEEEAEQALVLLLLRHKLLPAAP
jgi:ribosomal protein L12E/L44/L45/RPP1/RPP2